MGAAHYASPDDWEQAQLGLTGEYLFLLVLFKLVWPHLTYYECIAFIANEANVVKIFNKKNISRALCDWFSS
jgi:hypothetical protein